MQYYGLRAVSTVVDFYGKRMVSRIRRRAILNLQITQITSESFEKGR